METRRLVRRKIEVLSSLWGVAFLGMERWSLPSKLVEIGVILEHALSSPHQWAGSDEELLNLHMLHDEASFVRAAIRLQNITFDLNTRPSWLIYKYFLVYKLKIEYVNIHVFFILVLWLCSAEVVLLLVEHCRAFWHPENIVLIGESSKSVVDSFRKEMIGSFYNIPEVSFQHEPRWDNSINPLEWKTPL